MSQLDEKLKRPTPSQGTKPRATRRQIYAAWASGLVEDTPDRIELMVMGINRVWRRESGTGWEAVFTRES